MKASLRTSLRKVRRGLIVLGVIGAVFTVPVLSFYQLGKPVLAKFGPDSSHPLHQVVAMRVRPVDQTKQAPRLFHEPLISVTFDDGWQSNYTVALPILQKYGIRTTQYVLSGVESDPGYLSWDQIRQIKQAGHEIACHSVDHPDLTTLSAIELQHQLVGCQTKVQAEIDAPVTDFASPYGAENKQTLATIAKYYQSQRNVWGEVDDGIDGYDVNIQSLFKPYDIVGYSVENTTTLSDIKKLVAYTQAHNGWLVLIYHQISSNKEEWASTRARLEQDMAFISRSNIRVVTVNQVMQSREAN